MTVVLVRDSEKGYYRYRFKKFIKTFSGLSELAKFLSDNENIYLAPKQLSRKQLSILCKKLQSLRNRRTNFNSLNGYKTVEG